MRFLFKTERDHALQLQQQGIQKFCYAILFVLLLAASWVLPEYFTSQRTFILIYGVVGLGLMLLSGYTGLFRFKAQAHPRPANWSRGHYAY